MNLHDIIIDRSPAQKKLRLAAITAELKPLGYSVILTTSLAKLIAQARHQGSLEHAR